jgi:hypothetical protein
MADVPAFRHPDVWNTCSFMLELLGGVCLGFSWLSTRRSC